MACGKLLGKQDYLEFVASQSGLLSSRRGSEIEERRPTDHVAHRERTIEQGGRRRRRRRRRRTTKLLSLAVFHAKQDTAISVRALYQSGARMVGRSVAAARMCTELS